MSVLRGTYKLFSHLTEFSANNVRLEEGSWHGSKTSNSKSQMFFQEGQFSRNRVSLEQGAPEKPLGMEMRFRNLKRRQKFSSVLFRERKGRFISGQQ